MEIQQLDLEKHIKKATLFTNFVSGIVAVIIAISVGFGFYYNTKSTLDQHSEDIQEVKKDVREIKSDIQEVDVFKGVSEIEVKTLDDKINGIEENVSKIDEKLDLILLQTQRR
jgi:peptidoglycan hydrolase CwlO-like protein